MARFNITQMKLNHEARFMHAVQKCKKLYMYIYDLLKNIKKYKEASFMRYLITSSRSVRAHA